MELTPAQNQVASDSTRFRVLLAGRRFGKTILSVEEMLGVAIGKGNARVCYVAPTFQAARDIAWDYLKKRASPIAVKINESRLEIEIHNQHGGTSILFLRGWEAIENLRGQKFDFIVLDEVAMVRRFWENWQEVLRPTLTDARGSALFISTPKGFNHFYDLYNSTEDNFKSFHFTTYDNPHIPKDEVDEARRQMTEDRFAQEYLADFRKQEGLVYKEFDRKRHVFSEIGERTGRVICGVDFGYTNPAAVIRILVDSDRHYWVTDEWYKTGQTTEQIKSAIAVMRPELVYPDPAEPDRIQELSYSFSIQEVSKDISAGVDTVRELFKQNRLHIHKNCLSLIEELETYRYPDKKPDKNEEEKPVKENDHAVDALRYALHNSEPQNIQGSSLTNVRLYGSSYR